MIGRFQARWTSTALAFIATFSVPCTMPKASRAAASAGRPGMKAGGTSSTHSPAAAGTMTAVLPTRSTARPSKAMPMIAPTAKASRARLSWPSLRCSLSFTAGIRAVHVPRATPNSKNSNDVATRPRTRTRPRPAPVTGALAFRAAWVRASHLRLGPDTHAN